MFFRTPHNYDSDVDSYKSGVDFSDFPSLAQQNMKDECDINRIVATYARTGIMPDAPDAPGFFDAGDIFDFQTAMNQVRAAQESFSAMPSAVRERFQNDPGRLMAFLSDPDNSTEARNLGLLNPLPVPPVEQPPLDAPPASP